MNNFAIFVVGLIITLIAGIGVITSQVFIAYKKTIINNGTDNVLPKSIQNI